MSAADFLLSPSVQKLLQVLYGNPEEPFTTNELAQKTRLDAAEVEGTLAHLVGSGMLSRHAAKEELPETFTLDRGFVFHRELRRIALKSFAAAEPVRAMLRARFKDSVVRAFVLGEDANGIVEVLVVHGAVTPDEAAMTAACRKLSKAIHRHLQVHVISNARFDGLTPRDALGAKLAADTAFEIIAPGDTKARLKPERAGLLHSAKKTLAALSRSARRGE